MIYLKTLKQKGKQQQIYKPFRSNMITSRSQNFVQHEIQYYDDDGSPT